MKRLEKIKKLEKELNEANERNAELHKICQRQRDSLAAQQEAIVQLNVSLDSILACLAEKYGAAEQQEDGTTVRRISFPVNNYPGVLDRFRVSAARTDEEYIVTLEEIPAGDEGDDGQ